MLFDDLTIQEKAWAMVINGKLIDELHSGLLTMSESDKALRAPYDRYKGVVEAEYHHGGIIESGQHFNIKVEANINYYNDGTCSYFAVVDIIDEDGETMPDWILDIDGKFDFFLPGKAIVEVIYNELRGKVASIVPKINIDNAKVYNSTES